MTVSDRVNRRMEATRKRIIEAALNLFLEQGFEQASVAQISEAADIGKGTFFTYFSTKQDVLSFLGEQVLAIMVEADDPSERSADRLRHIFTSAATWFEDNEALARQMCIARLSSLTRADVQSSTPDLLKLFGDILTSGIESHEFRPVKFQPALTLLASAYFVPVALWARDPQKVNLSDSLDAQLELALSALES
ncbi:TetR/AcrR family transcriptional regulator [Corynebacterium sp.]|uniref:TetR/AcrR family transcriptional regulator n=1 Tax=Corynebacterium sp. TaxID=1720 RepID=UPI0026DD3095|nr:TetR/AcrR family transcriptional regulator [Corynebacterium sp.]MDO4914463.1 TetR/AcrR family transcriptional regulator [Corynebacterium sp.]